MVRVRLDGVAGEAFAAVLTRVGRALIHVHAGCVCRGVRLTPLARVEAQLRVQALSAIVLRLRMESLVLRRPSAESHAGAFHRAIALARVIWRPEELARVAAHAAGLVAALRGRVPRRWERQAVLVRPGVLGRARASLGNLLSEKDADG